MSICGCRRVGAISRRRPAVDAPGAKRGTPSAGASLTARPLDVTDAAAVEHLVAEAEDTLGPV
ncbi:hypothetical protein AB0K17_29410, partial [Streptomyces sp. NPDC049585]